jgi:hypothetical protein
MLARRDIAAALAVLAAALATVALGPPPAAAGHGARQVASPRAAGAAAGFTPLWSQPVAGERLVVGDGATMVWAAQSGAGQALLARHYDGAGRPLGDGPVVLVDGIAGLSDWVATTDGGSGVLLAWKAGGTVSVAGRTATGGSLFTTATACSDAAVAASRGAGAAATPVALQTDGRGGAYLLLAVTPSSSAGDSLLEHVSATGELAAPDPGVTVKDGTAALVAADGEGHLVVLLTGPGRSGVGVQRFSPELAADWPAPSTPYNPLAGPPSAAAQTPVGLGASPGIWMAWREGQEVRIQRFASGGDRLWFRPAAVTAAEGAAVAGDGDGGVYVTSAAADTLRVAHVPAEGPTAGPPAESTLKTSRTGVSVDGLTSDKSGDLDVAFSDDTGAGVAEMTCLGAWTAPTLSPPAARLGALTGDGSGGAYAVDDADPGRLWRFGEIGGALTLRPRAAELTYGDTLDVSGYLTLDGAPLPDVAVRLTPTAGTAPPSTQTGADGFYETSFKPQASASWTAGALGPGGATIASAPSVPIAVAPRISLTLTTRRVGSVYVTAFTGEVAPGHAGSTVLVQLKKGSAWRPLASAKLNAASAYRATWKVPIKTATYLIRTVLPAHADHAEGVSPTARLRVVVKPA